MRITRSFLLLGITALAGCEGVLELGSDEGAPSSPPAEASGQGGGAVGDASARDVDSADSASSADQLGCDGPLAGAGRLDPLEELSGELHPVAGGYVAFYRHVTNTTTGRSEMRARRFDESLVPIGSALTIFGELDGASPAWSVKPDGDGFVASAHWSSRNIFRLTTLDAAAVPTWSVESGGEPLVALGPGVPVAGAGHVLVNYTDVAGPIGTVIARGSAKLDPASFAIRSVCRGGVEALTWRADRFEGICSDGVRASVRLDGRTSLEPLALAAAPVASSEHCMSRIERTSGAAAWIYASGPARDASKSCSFQPFADAASGDTFTIWANRLADGAPSWASWSRAASFPMATRRAFGFALDGPGLVAHAQRKEGGFEIRRVTLDGKERGPTYAHASAEPVTSIAVDPVRGGYLVRSYEGASLVAVDRLGCP